MDRTKERLGTTDRGVIKYRQMLFQQIELVQKGEDPINTFRDLRENQCIALPVPWDRGYAWGRAKDGSYVRGAATAADMIPQHIKDEVEELYVRAAENRARKQPADA